MGDATPLFDDLEYPGHGMRDRAQNRMVPLSSWFRFATDQGLGKKTNLLYDAETEVAQTAREMNFEIQGSDLDAVPMQITLGTPYAIPRRVSDFAGENIENQTGEFSAHEIGAANYPGTGGPIIWPPFTAIVTWGVGGARTRALVDFIGGTKINLGPATFVSAQAVVTADAIHVPATTGLYTLSAFVGPGNPFGSNAQRTIYVGTLNNNAESNIFSVPPFARRATIIGCDPVVGAGPPALTAGYIRFWQSPDGTKNVGNFFLNGNQPTSFPVPNGGQYFSIISTIGIDTVPFSAAFELAL
jgi:hypothetical protein